MARTTNYDNRRYGGRVDFVREMHTWGKPVVVITNNSFPMSVHPEFKTVLCTYSTARFALEEAVKCLFGS